MVGMTPKTSSGRNRQRPRPARRIFAFPLIALDKGAMNGAPVQLGLVERRTGNGKDRSRSFPVDLAQGRMTMLWGGDVCGVSILHLADESIPV